MARSDLPAINIFPPRFRCINFSQCSVSHFNEILFKKDIQNFPLLLEKPSLSTVVPPPPESFSIFLRLSVVCVN